MTERTGDYEWRGEGEGAEIVLYGPDDSALERTQSATSLPGVESPVYAASSQSGFGLVAASSTHAAPDLVSPPERGLILVAGASVGGLNMPPEEIPRFVFRNLSEVGLPGLGGVPGAGKFCEFGASRAAEQCMIEEEDLAFLGPRDGDSDALGRRALEAGGRGWEKLGNVGVYAVREVLDAEGAEKLGIGPKSLVLTVDAEAGDLGRLALTGHRHRILDGEFGSDPVLPAAPVESEEARDLLAAINGASNFADGRAALTLYALRQAISNAFGDFEIRASWISGGFEERDGLLVQRQHLADRGPGEACMSGDAVVAGTGGMLQSLPRFEASGEEGICPWEEAVLLERWVNLERLDSKG